MNPDISAHDLLAKNIFLTVATVDGSGQPWNSPVAFSYDNDLNIYWRSDQNSQHSKNILQNPKVFIVVKDFSTRDKALYLQAVATEVGDEQEIKHALSIDRHPQYKDEPAAFLGDNPRRYYKAIPVKAWINATPKEIGKLVDDREEIVLKKKATQ